MNPETTQNIINILLTMASASLIPIATGAGAFVVQKLKMQALNIKGDVFNKTQLAVKTAIFSAEQQGKSGKLTTNSSKKDHATKLAKKLLEKQKIKVDPDVLSELIEANVWEEMTSPQVVATALAESKEELQEQAKEVPSDFIGEVIESEEALG
jgi:hypothetical protein